jgi:RsiW-degrading membrane proteinase PrsW (M82 family)
MPAPAAAIVLAVLAAAPALLVLVTMDRQDVRGGEPRWLLRRAALGGALVVVPVLAVQLVLALAGLPVRGTNAGTVLVSSMLVVAIPEELGKAAVLAVLLARRLELEGRVDGIRYGARIGLGFAIVENAYYGALVGDIGSFALFVAARTLLTVPMHAMCGAIVGDFVARRRIEGRGVGLVAGLAAAAAVHGLFDFGLGIASLAKARGDSTGFVAAIALVLAVLGVALVAVRRRTLLARIADAEDERAASGQ